MKNLFIFGAGASREAGAPLMSEFIDKADRLRRNPPEGISLTYPAFEGIFEAQRELRTLYEKSYVDLDNIENLFGLVEMARFIRRLGNKDLDTIKELATQVVTFITETLEYTIRFMYVDGQFQPPVPYGEFLSMLLKHGNRHRPGSAHQFAFITFNYDLALDYSLYFHNFKCDYCLTEQPVMHSTPYLKLHGSINWGICQECGDIVPRLIPEAHFRVWPDHTKSVFYNLGTTLHLTKHHDKPIKGPPLLVPPTWNQGEYHRQLRNVWRRAADELAAAENLFVIGYSLPETDSFFRYLFALGSDSRVKLRKFVLVDPDPQDNVEPRFRSFMGRAIE